MGARRDVLFSKPPCSGKRGPGRWCGRGYGWMPAVALASPKETLRTAPVRTGRTQGGGEGSVGGGTGGHERVADRLRE